MNDNKYIFNVIKDITIDCIVFTNIGEYDPLYHSIIKGKKLRNLKKGHKFLLIRKKEILHDRDLPSYAKTITTTNDNIIRNKIPCWVNAHFNSKRKIDDIISGNIKGIQVCDLISINTNTSFILTITEETFNRFFKNERQYKIKELKENL